jgi:DNA-binding transcriptional regulator YhcF (GntR family)
MRLDKRHPMPVYLQLGQMLKSQITQGVYRAHQQLPSERELCHLYNMSRMTARRSLLELVNEGWAYTCAGKGTFVSERPQGGLADLGIENHSWQQVADVLIDSLLVFDSVGAEKTMVHALADFPVEVVALQLLPAVLEQVIELHANGEMCLQAEHFASNMVRNKLMAVFNACDLPTSARKIVVGCAPGDHHEIGALLLAIVLRQRGYSVVFMGQNMPAQQFSNVLRLVNPCLICFSATTEVSVRALGELTTEITRQADAAPWVGFGGQAFVRKPALRHKISGEFLGETVQEGIERILQMDGL